MLLKIVHLLSIPLIFQLHYLLTGLLHDFDTLQRILLFSITKKYPVAFNPFSFLKLWLNTYNIQLAILAIFRCTYNSAAPNTFMTSHNHHHNLFSNFFITLNRNSAPMNSLQELSMTCLLSAWQTLICFLFLWICPF